MKVFVSGGTGFVGGRLCERLVADGNEVRVLARPSSDDRLLRELGVGVVVGDLLDPAAVRRAVDGCGVAFHAARQEPRIGRVAAAEAVNVEGTMNVARACARAGVDHLVHIGSTHVYGRPRRLPVSERTVPRPVLLHDRTKLAADEAVVRHARESGLSTTVARLAAVYGPRDRRVLPLFERAVRGRFPVLGRGDVAYHVVYVDDAVDGLLRCGTRRGQRGERYLLAGPDATTVAGFAGAVADAAGSSLRLVRLPAAPFRWAERAARAFWAPFGYEPDFARKVDFLVRERRFDISKAKRELGYEPRVPLREGVRRTLEWYRSAGLL